ncbi:MAG: tetratricopeptide repeat protein, partial [Candidatus Heimdallarchaeaceae archaeon]
AYYRLAVAAFYLRDRGKKDLEKYVEKSLVIFKEKEAKYYIHKIEALIAGDHYRNERFFESTKIIEKCLSYYKETDNEYEIAKSLQYLGMIYGRKVLQKALSMHEDSIDIFSRLEQHHDEAKGYLEISGIQRRKGEYNKALESLSKYYKIKDKLDDEICLGIAHNRIGELLLLKGELGFAEENFELALTIAKKREDKSTLALIYSNLGELNYKKVKLGEAERYYTQSMEKHEEVGKDRDIADSLLKLIIVHLKLESLDSAKINLSKLRKLSKKTESEITKQIYRLSDALILNNIGGEKERNQAILLLKTLNEENIKDDRIRIEVLLNLCKLLSMQIRESKEEEQKESIFKELDSYITKFSEIAEKQASFILKVESLFLLSYLDILKSETEFTGVAEQHLRKAKMLAENKNLTKYVKTISNEHEFLLQQLEKDEDSSKKILRIEERIDLRI